MFLFLAAPRCSSERLSCENEKHKNAIRSSQSFGSVYNSSVGAKRNFQANTVQVILQILKDVRKELFPNITGDALLACNLFSFTAVN